MSERTRIPGPRDLRATLDGDGTAETAVVACPPHPQLRGDRHDSRLQAVSDGLGPGIDCLRFDYGPWDEGHGERTDARNALLWATERYERTGLFGFSFGGAIALLAGVPDREPVPDVVSALAPASRLSGGLDAADALAEIPVPVQIVYGKRDETADWKPVVERARELDCSVESLSADHFFVGQQQKAADLVCSFLRDSL